MEEQNAIVVLLREKELLEMDSRELLHRYGSILEQRGIIRHQARFDELNKLERELWVYQTELLKRLQKVPNDFKSRI